MGQGSFGAADSKHVRARSRSQTGFANGNRRGFPRGVPRVEKPAARRTMLAQLNAASQGTVALARKRAAAVMSQGLPCVIRAGRKA